MKIFKLLSAVGMAALLVATLGGSAMAYHDGGVARCEGCHTMHNSLKGAVQSQKVNSDGTKSPIGTIANAPGSFLLQGSDQSSTCLNCHQAADTVVGLKAATPLSKNNSYHISTAGATVAGGAQVPVELTPGGDFAWLRYAFSWTLPRNGSSAKQTHGHNIVASDYGYAVDPDRATAPGSTLAYPSNKLYCISCHDPHGKYRIVDASGTVAGGTNVATPLPTDGSGSYGTSALNGGAAPTATTAVGVYRLLAGKGYEPMSMENGGTTYAFNANAPVAVSPSNYNHSEQTNPVRVAYGSGMSEWCANCHDQFLNSADAGVNHRHPAGAGAKFTAAIADNYNKYVSTGSLGANSTNSYNSIVPFETGDGYTNIATLNGQASIDGSQMGGPSTSNNVMCLSCHRAHASGFDSMMRWNNSYQYLMGDNNSAWPNTGDAEGIANGRTSAELQVAYYDRLPGVFSPYQRSLCNKCHIKD